MQKNHMPSQEYSKEIQLEILDEIVANQGTTNTIERTESVREWNYNFLLTQKYIEQEFSSSNVFRHASESGMLVSEKLTDAGKLWRSDLYDRIQKDKIEKHTAKIQKRMLYITLALLVLATYPILRDTVSVLLCLFSR